MFVSAIVLPQIYAALCQIFAGVSTLPPDCAVHKYPPMAVVNATPVIFAAPSTLTPPMAVVDATPVIFAVPLRTMLEVPTPVAAHEIWALPPRARVALAVPVAAVDALALTKRSLAAAPADAAAILAALVVLVIRCIFALAMVEIDALQLKYLFLPPLTRP